jgi:hypothetical protein
LNSRPFSDIGGSDKHVRLLLGTVLVAYGLWGIVKPVIPNFGRNVHLAGFVAGVLSGILTAATGVFVIPLVPYLQSLKLSKDPIRKLDAAHCLANSKTIQVMDAGAINRESHYSANFRLTRINLDELVTNFAKQRLFRFL